MSLKPGDFLFGIVEFLAYLVPGMILLLTLPESLVPVPCILDQINFSHRPLLGDLFLLLLSYIIGHFIHFAGALIFNPIYERYFLRAKIKKHSEFVELAKKDIANLLPGHQNSLRMGVAFIRQRQPSLSPDLDKHEANSKLFRGLTLLCLYLCFLPYTREWYRFALFFLAALSFLRFANQRWRLHLLICEYFLLITLQSRKNES